MRFSLPLFLALFVGACGDGYASQESLGDAGDAAIPIPTATGTATTVPTSPPPNDAGGPPSCAAGTAECVGDVPRVCSAAGVWTVQPACGGVFPYCAGGACRAFRVRGGIGTMPHDHNLGAHGMEPARRICTGALCLTGGVKP